MSGDIPTATQRKTPGRHGPQEVFPGQHYTADEVEFMMAMDRYKREKNRPNPTWEEVLSVVKSLGYRKVAESTFPWSE